MNRIPIIIQGAFLENGASVVSGGIEYTLTWNEATLSLELSSSASDEIQTIELTGIGGGSGGGLTEDQVREIAAQQIIEAIDNGDFASIDDIPKNISDLVNDTGFVTPSDLTDITDRIDAIDDQITTLDEKIDNVSSGGGSGGGGTQEPITVSPNVGNIPVGKTYPPGTTLEDIIKDLLDPPVLPTFVAPKLSISGSDSNVEIGAGQTKNVTITLTFDRGSISTGGYRAGEAIEYSLNDGAYQASNVFNVTVSESNKTFKGKVKYGEGDQPKDSKGEDYGEPLEAGEVESGTLTYKFASAITLWSNAANIMVVAKEASVDIESKTHIFQFAPQTEENPEIFDVPAAWSVTSIECINDITGQWQSVAGDFDVSDTTHDGRSYKRYTDNREYDDGGRDIKITWS